MITGGVRLLLLVPAWELSTECYEAPLSSLRNMPRAAELFWSWFSPPEDLEMEEHSASRRLGTLAL